MPYFEVVSPKIGIERRQGTRFSLRLRCRVAFPWLGPRQLTGFTRDMSRSGVLVKLNKTVGAELVNRLGASATVSIDLPHGPAFTPRCLVCMTTIVRIVDAESPKPSVALEIHRMLVEDRGPQASPGRSSLVERFVSGRIR
jgi:hypothetical protein